MEVEVSSMQELVEHLAKALVDETDAVAALVALVQTGFGEDACNV